MPVLLPLAYKQTGLPALGEGDQRVPLLPAPLDQLVQLALAWAK